MMTALAKVMRTCAAVGCPAVVIHPITRSEKEKEWETNMMLYRQLMPIAKETGATLAFEEDPMKAVEGGALSINLAFTHPCPIPPGFVVDFICFGKEFAPLIRDIR